MLGALGQLMEWVHEPNGSCWVWMRDGYRVVGVSECAEPCATGKAMSKIVKRHIPSQGSRAEFEKFFVELPKHIKEQLLQGKLRLVWPTDLFN